MKLNKRLKYGIVSALAIGCVTFIFVNKETTPTENNKVNKNNSIESRTFNQHRYEIVDSDTITKTFNGNYFDPLVTFAEPKDSFNIQLEGLQEDNDVFIINPLTGEMTPLEYANTGIFQLTTSLDNSIDYGIIMDNILIGSIRVEENLNSIDVDSLFKETLENLDCGL